MCSAVSSVTASATLFFLHLKISGGRDKARGVREGGVY